MTMCSAYIRRMRLSLFLCMLFASLALQAQRPVFRGQVVDSISRAPLAFVSIQVEGKPELAAMSDIDGKFLLELPGFPVRIRFSYVGYRVSTIEWLVKPEGEKRILLSPTSLALKEVQIKAGENPAHRIIHNVWAARNRHDPSALNSYRCNTYNKLILTGRKDTAWVPASDDQSRRAQVTDSLFERQHLFMVESFSTRIFKSGRSKEIVKASKVSGMKEASVFMLALQYQPFTFYEPLLEVSGKKYVNPISRNSEALYFFSLEDTLFAGKDTVYVISYKPQRNKIFEGLSGVLYISAPDYAIQNAIAEPARDEGTFRIKIQQQYKKTPGGQWFPEQLNTDLRFLNLQVPGNKLVGESRTYVSAIEINPEVRNREFDEVSLEVETEASSQSESYWDSVRIERLNRQERRTYQVIDSISRRNNLSLRLKLAESVMRGYFPIKFMDVDISRIIAFTQYEGFRLGVGGITNDRLSRRFGVGGYYAYGFRDVHSKYKAEGRYYISKNRDFFLAFSWGRDVFETGAAEILIDRKPKQAEAIRNILIARMHQEERTEANLGFRWLKYITSTVFVRQTHAKALFDYSFLTQNKDKRYSWLESGLSLRFAWGEQYYQSGNLKLSMGTQYPVLYGQICYGYDQSGLGKANFLKADIKAEKSFSYRRWGQSHIQLLAGHVEGRVPLMRLYTGRSNLLQKDNLKVSSFNAFETMLMNEITCNQYAALFLQQDLGSFFRIKNWSPAFSLVQNTFFGKLTNPHWHQPSVGSDARNGYFEAGLKISDLIRYNVGSYGAGGFYRFGSFAHADWKKNIFVKLNVGLSF